MARKQNGSWKTKDSEGYKPSAAGQVLKRLVENGIKVRDVRFGKTAKALEVYDQSDDLPWDTEHDPQLSEYIKINLTQQYKREIGARLYNAAPVFKVTAQPWSQPIARNRSAMMDAYLNYCGGESIFDESCEDALLSGLGYGRGIGWIGFDADKPNVITMVQDSWRNFVTDPDAKRKSQWNWVARIRSKPRWSLMQDYPEKKASIAEMEASCRPSDEDSKLTSVKEDQARESNDKSTEMVTYYEIWMRVGLHNYKGGYEPGKSTDEPKKYIIGSDGTLLFKGDWETPLWRDGRWPCEVFDPVNAEDSAWPDSPLRPGLPWLRAMNLVATMMMAKYRLLDGRTIVAVAQSAGIQLSEDDIEALLYSTRPVDIIQPAIATLDGGADIQKVIQSFTMQSDRGADMDLFRFLQEQFEKETGLHQFLYAGEPGKQDRSALATEVRRENSRSRIDQMQAKWDKFMQQVARTMALTARYHLDGEDIAPILGPEAGQAWGQLLAVEDTDADSLAQQYVAEGIDPAEALQIAEQVTAGATTLDEWIHEIDYGIEVGSMRRKSPEQEAELANMANQQIVPAAYQVGDFESVALWQSLLAKHAGASPEQIEHIQSLPQRMQAMQQQQAQMAQPEQAAPM